MAQESIWESNHIIQEVIDVLRNQIIGLEQDNKIPHGYLKTSLALHVPRFSEIEIYNKNNFEFQSIFEEAKRLALRLGLRMNEIPEEYLQALLVSNKFSKMKNDNESLYEVDTAGNKAKIEFREIDPDLGVMIQGKLHYIAQARSDTLFHFGLFRRTSKYPFAYCAYSLLDRKYLLDAMPFSTEMDKVLVLTRSFSINSSPINSMSLLLGMSANKIREKHGNNYSAIVTAVNPNIMFKGTVFKGTSFFTFATVPFIPSYYLSNYITRKSLDDLTELIPNELENNKIDCKPIIWMGTGMTSEITQKFRNARIIQVSPNSYLAG